MRKLNKGNIRLGQHLSPSTEFKKGNVPHNVGKSWDYWLPKKSQKKLLKTTYKKGHLPWTAKPKGTIRREKRIRKNGIQEIYYTINIDWHGNRKPHNSYKWFLWEVYNQKDRPKGMVLAVKDGNPDNIKLDNFEVITRAENLRRNLKHNLH